MNIKKEWRDYSSENGENWQILANSDEAETEADLKSETGQNAIMGFNYQASDFVAVTIISASKYRDSKQENDPLLKNRFYLYLYLLNGDQWFCLSKDNFDKENILLLANIFVGTNKRQAERIWISKKLGPLNTFRP